MKAVADTGIIIGLAKANRLSLLKNLFGKVLIPPKVHKELLARTGSEEALIEERLDESLLQASGGFGQGTTGYLRPEQNIVTKTELPSLEEFEFHQKICAIRCI